MLLAYADSLPNDKRTGWAIFALQDDAESKENGQNPSNIFRFALNLALRYVDGLKRSIARRIF